MSISHVKALAWIAASGLFGYMFLFAWNFAIGLPEPLYQYVWFLSPSDTQAELKLGPSKDLQEGVLGSVEAPPPELDDRVDYAVVQSALIDLDWSGTPAPVQVAVETTSAEDAKPPVTPVEELLRVIFIRYDGRTPEDSLAFVKYIDPQLAAAPTAETQLFPGDHLADPHAHIRVEAIRPGVVVFAFDDEEREHEELLPARYGESASYITKVAEGGEAVLPATVSYIGDHQEEVWRPARTTAVGSKDFVLGAEDLAHIGENWQEILSREVRTRRHRDPLTGKYDGLEISSIAPGSVASRHGVQTGDILKSINGHPVSSKPEAISFVKNNDDVYDTWEVVVERLGRDVTMTYEEPPAE